MLYTHHNLTYNVNDTYIYVIIELIKMLNIELIYINLITSISYTICINIRIQSGRKSTGTQESEL